MKNKTLVENKIKEKKDDWELNSGLFEIYWKNNVAVKVRINGVEFVYKK